MVRLPMLSYYPPSSLSHALHVLLLVAVLAAVKGENRREGEICISETNTYTARVDIHASERGKVEIGIVGIVCAVVVL